MQRGRGLWLSWQIGGYCLSKTIIKQSLPTVRFDYQFGAKFVRRSSFQFGDTILTQYIFAQLMYNY